MVMVMIMVENMVLVCAVELLTAGQIQNYKQKIPQSKEEITLNHLFPNSNEYNLVGADRYLCIAEHLLELPVYSILVYHFGRRHMSCHIISMICGFKILNAATMN